MQNFEIDYPKSNYLNRTTHPDLPKSGNPYTLRNENLNLKNFINLLYFITEIEELK